MDTVVEVLGPLKIGQFFLSTRKVALVSQLTRLKRTFKKRRALALSSFEASPRSLTD